MNSTIQTITGVFEVTQGKRPVGIVSSQAIETLQEAAATRLYDKQIALCDALKDVQSLYYTLFSSFTIATGYFALRTINILGSQGGF